MGVSNTSDSTAQNDVINFKVTSAGSKVMTAPMPQPKQKPKARASISHPTSSGRSDLSGRSRSASFLSRVISKRGGPLEPLAEDNIVKTSLQIKNKDIVKTQGQNYNSLPRRFSQYYSENDESILDNTSTLSNPRRRSLTVTPSTHRPYTWTKNASTMNELNGNNQDRSKEATINDLKKRAEARKNETLIKRVNSMPNGSSAAVNSAREKFLAKIGEDPTK